MDTVGRYRVERRIGAGSFATVWLGHDDDLDVPVAIKVLADNWAGNDDVRQRFLAEARILRRIHDPRLVQVYDIGTLADGRPYFVMDYIDGGSLNDLRKGGLEPLPALWLCAEACRAIEVLHRHDIIHRDVTPGNLLLGRSAAGEPHVLIADLGVAKSMIDGVGATMTAGTPSYMAPEQARGAVTLDRRADIYSLAAVTYAMLTGGPPYRMQSIADILARDPEITPPPIAASLGAPASLDAVLASGLATDRERRPPTALLLAEGLERIARELVSGPPTGRATVLTPSPSYPVSAPPISDPLPSARPDSAYSDSAHSDSAHSDSAHSDSAYPDSAYSDSAYSNSAYSDSGYPHPAYPHSAYPESEYSDSSPVDPDDPEAAPAHRRRSSSTYVLVAVGAVALFAIAMFVTILLVQLS
jgi:serine/threonine protein kinase